MRKGLLLLWLMLPVLAGAYHYGPGQERLVLDDVSDVLAQADVLAADQKWIEAVEKYDEALVQLPADRAAESRRIRLERAKAQMLAKKLPVVNKELAQLVDEIKDAEPVDDALLAEARSALANSQYYMTWLMRLEGQPKERWEPEIEAARQNFRFLAELHEKSGKKDAAKSAKEDLESAVNLARMDLSDLQGLPLPSQ